MRRREPKPWWEMRQPGDGYLTGYGGDDYGDGFGFDVDDADYSGDGECNFLTGYGQGINGNGVGCFCGLRSGDGGDRRRFAQ